ncbi:MAG: lysostaphin resistance A-like protein [Clostridium sp.]
MKEITVWKLIGICLGVQVVGVISILIMFGKSFDGNLVTLILSASTIAVLLKVGKVNKELIMERINDFKKKFKLKEIMGGIGVQMLLSLALVSIISAVVYSINPDYAIEMMKDEPMATDTTFKLFIATISSSIMAPILEEIVFRRILFNRFSRKIGILGGAILSSVLFGILHIELAMIGAMVFGITSCILYRKYNNILIPISVHFINNSIVSIVLVFVTVMDKILGNTEPIDYTMTTSDIRFNIIFGGIVLIIAMIIFGRFVYKNRIYLKRVDETNALIL